MSGLEPAPDMILSYRVVGSLLIYQSEARPHGFRKDTPENRAWLKERGYELRHPTTSDVASD